MPNTVLDPVLLHALECLRSVAVALKSDTLFAKWCAKGLGGVHHAVPHVDSPCSWGSTLEMIQVSLKLREDLEQLQLAVGGVAMVLPPEEGWARLKDSVPPLEVVEMGMAVLGCTPARASQVVPVLCHCSDRFNAIDCSDGAKALGTLFAEELAGTIDRNLQKHFPSSLQRGSSGPLYKAFQASGIQSPYHALQVAALLAVGPDPRFKLDDTDTRSRLEKFCISCLEQAGTFRKKAQPAEVEHEDPSPLKRRKLERIGSFMAALDKPVEHSDVDKNLGDARQQVRNGVRNFLGRESFAGAKSGESICSWWVARQDEYRDLVPGVRTILGWSAGNPDVERLFGKSSETLTATRKQNRLYKVLLKKNAVQLAVSGYTAEEIKNMIEEMVDAAEGDLDGESSDCEEGEGEEVEDSGADDADPGQHFGVASSSRGEGPSFD